MAAPLPKPVSLDDGQPAALKDIREAADRWLGSQELKQTLDWLKK